MLNVSGHLLSTMEVEAALVDHPCIAETAVVAHPHPVKGECLYCFIVLKDVRNYTLINYNTQHCPDQNILHALNGVDQSLNAMCFSNSWQFIASALNNDITMTVFVFDKYYCNFIDLKCIKTSFMFTGWSFDSSNDDFILVYNHSF